MSNDHSSVLTRPRDGRHRAGITLNAFRLNTVANHIMFTGRRGRVYDQIARLSGVRPGDSVLDVGSSSGYLTRRLAAAAGPSGHATGIDPAEKAIAYATRQAGPGLTYAVGIAQDLSFPDSSFDVVTCALAMHHIPESQRQAAFTEMYRVTKPGGRMLTADMSVMLRHAGRRSPARQGAAEPGPFEDLATAAGYEIESAGRLPLLSYIVAVRPTASGT